MKQDGELGALLKYEMCSEVGGKKNPAVYSEKPLHNLP